MGTLGELLRTAREDRGLSLAQLEAVTKIRQKYLAALESGDFATLPSPVYVRGYLRTYARCVGLDPVQVVAIYEQVRPQGEAVGVQREVHPPRTPGAITGGSLVAVVVVLLLAALGSYLYQQYNLFVAGGLPDQGMNLAVGPRLGPTPASVLAADPTIQAQATPAPQPTVTPVPTVPPIQGVHLEVRFKERTWVRVTVDERLVYEGIPQIGSVMKWDGREKIFMRTGNAGGTEVSFNGMPSATLGAPGEVKDVQWTAAR